MKVYIAQVLCPQRHAIYARSGELPDEVLADEGLLDMAKAELQKIAMEEVRQGMTENPPRGWIENNVPQMNPWCRICAAKLDTWKVEVGITPWSSLEEARPHLLAEQSRQLRSQQLIDKLAREIVGESLRKAGKAEQN